MNALALQLSMLTRAVESFEEAKTSGITKELPVSHRTKEMKARINKFSAHIEKKEIVTINQLAEKFQISYISARWTIKQMEADGIVRPTNETGQLAWRLK